MRMLGRWLLIEVIVLGYTLAVPARVSACSCFVEDTPQEHLASADTVFVGKVVKIEPLVDAEGILRNYTTFEIATLWKGPALSPLTLKTGRGGGDCGYPFTVGQYYLVYGIGNKLRNFREGQERPNWTEAGQTIR